MTNSISRYFNRINKDTRKSILLSWLAVMDVMYKTSPVSVIEINRQTHRHIHARKIIKRMKQYGLIRLVRYEPRRTTNHQIVDAPLYELIGHHKIVHKGILDRLDELD